MSSSVIYYFTRYKFEYYPKKEKPNIAKFREKDLNLKWLTLYVVDPLPDPTTSREEELWEAQAKGKGKKKVDTSVQGEKAFLIKMNKLGAMKINKLVPKRKAIDLPPQTS